jgi:hypothetical protein
MKRALWLSLFFMGCEQEQDVGLAGPGAELTAVSHSDAVTAPPLWGSSVLPLSDTKLVVADTEGDALHLVTYDNTRVAWTSHELDLPSGSRPTRLAETGDGHVVVLLRGTGEVALVDARYGAVRWRRTVCAQPRGVAWSSAEKAALVTCASGELLTVTHTSTRSLDLGEDLRDVLVVNGKRWVTTFRSAQLLELDDSGAVVTRLSPPSLSAPAGTFAPHVAWRTVTDGKLIIMSHQLHLLDDVNALAPVPTAPYYGDGLCLSSAVTSALTVFDPAARTVLGSTPRPGALPIDVAIAGSQVAVVSAANGTAETYDTSSLTGGYCLTGGWPQTSVPNPVGVGIVNGALAVVDRSGWFGIAAPTEMDGRGLRRVVAIDTARKVFHTQAPSGVACASCHAEGYDDGHTWQFGLKHVRTQSLEGGLLKTAPYHWEGELDSISALLSETLVHRMGGNPVPGTVASALGDWLNTIPARQGAPTDALGAQYFMSDGCSSCHSGTTLTNNATVDVGTGGAYQVPSLRAVSWRGPWLHDGCAKTLKDRFSTDCHGDTHAPVPADHVDALVAFLKSL